MGDISSILHFAFISVCSVGVRDMASSNPCRRVSVVILVPRIEYDQFLIAVLAISQAASF